MTICVSLHNRLHWNVESCAAYSVIPNQHQYWESILSKLLSILSKLSICCSAERRAGRPSSSSSGWWPRPMRDARSRSLYSPSWARSLLLAAQQACLPSTARLPPGPTARHCFSLPSVRVWVISCSFHSKWCQVTISGGTLVLSISTS